MTMERKRKKKGGANKKDASNKKDAAAISNKIKRETKTELPQNDNLGMYNIKLFIEYLEKGKLCSLIFG